MAKINLMLGYLLLAVPTAMTAQTIPTGVLVEELLRIDARKALDAANQSAMPSIPPGGGSLVVPSIGLNPGPTGTPPAPEPEKKPEGVLVTAIYGVSPAYVVHAVVDGEPMRYQVGQPKPKGAKYSLVSVAGKCASFAAGKARRDACYSTSPEADAQLLDAPATVVSVGE